jgi:hypothetical protein
VKWSNPKFGITIAVKVRQQPSVTDESPKEAFNDTTAGFGA